VGSGRLIDMTSDKGVDWAEERRQLGLRPMAEFDPSQPARLYDALGQEFFDWDPRQADHYRKWARPAAGAPGLIDYDGLELLGWQLRSS
jgi:hypothetical protein